MSGLFDRVKCRVQGTPGTGAITLGAAFSGFRTFAAVPAPSGQVSYAIEDGDTKAEVGHGTYDPTGNTLARTTIFWSTSGNAPIDCSSAAVVGDTLLAEDLNTILVANSYRYEQPFDGDTLTAPAGLGRYVLDPLSELNTMTIVLPPGAADGQAFRVSTTHTIDSFTATPAAGQALLGGGPFVLAANGGAQWMFRSADGTWYPG